MHRVRPMKKWHRRCSIRARRFQSAVANGRLDGHTTHRPAVTKTTAGRLKRPVHSLRLHQLSGDFQVAARLRAAVHSPAGCKFITDGLRV